MALIMQAVLATCLCLAGDIWKELEMFYASWPYCLVYLAMSSSTAEAKLKLVRELFDASTCCLDEYFTEKVLALYPRLKGFSATDQCYSRCSSGPGPRECATWRPSGSSDKFASRRLYAALPRDS